MATAVRKSLSTAGKPATQAGSVSVSGVGVLDKSVSVLAALAQHGSLGLAELVESTGLSRPTAHRLASALEVHGLVGRDKQGRWVLGLRLFSWGGAAAARIPLVEVAQPVLTALRDQTGESVQLYVRDGDQRVCVAAAEPIRGLRDTVPVGAMLPLTAGSGGKVLLAWATDLDRFSDIDRAAIAAVRSRGWAASVAEREPGVASVSAPVIDAAGTIRAAVSVSGPIDRLGRYPGRRFAGDVLAAAREIEDRANLRSDLG